MDNTIQRNRSLGQSTWIDYIRRGMLTTGELDHLVNQGVTGLTSNPTIFEKAVSKSTDYDEALVQLSGDGKLPSEVFESLTLADIQQAADILLSVYRESNAADGYASLEVPPALAHDTEGTIREARRLWAALDRPNVMIKIPATKAGMPAISALIGEGINVNVTLIFSLNAYREVMDSYISGIKALAGKGLRADTVASVASFFVSRVDTAVDALLETQKDATSETLRGTAAVANARAAYALFQERFAESDFMELVSAGARVQRPLWASTSTKNPSYSDTLYVDSLIGPDTVNTMPPETLAAVLDHGVSSNAMVTSRDDGSAALAALSEAGIDMDDVTSKLLSDGVHAFAESFDGALSSIQTKCVELAATGT